MKEDPRLMLTVDRHKQNEGKVTAKDSNQLVTVSGELGLAD